MPQERGNRSLGWIEPVAVRLARFLQSSDRVFMRKPTPSRRRRPTASVRNFRCRSRPLRTDQRGRRKCVDRRDAGDLRL